MGEYNDKEKLVYSFLGNESFKRFVGNLELYQKMLAEAKTREERLTLMVRMHKIHFRRERKDTPEDVREMNTEYDKMIAEALSWCENGEFTNEKLARRAAEIPFAEKLLAKWNPHAGETVDGGALMVNDLVAYHVDSPEVISLHVITANIPKERLLVEVLEGFKLFAQKLQEPEMAGIQTIKMESWLLSKDFVPKIKMIFGEDIELSQVEKPGTNEEIDVAKRLPLKFNYLSLQRYLAEGKEPEIGELLLSKEDFIKAMEKL